MCLQHTCGEIDDCFLNSVMFCLLACFPKLQHIEFSQLSDFCVPDDQPGLNIVGNRRI